MQVDGRYRPANATERRTASAWSSQDAVEKTRLKAEAAAFDKLVTEVEHVWRAVVRSHG